MLDSTMYTLTVLLACALLAVRVPAQDPWPWQPIPDQNAIVDKHNSLRRSVRPTASNMLKMSWNTDAAANAQMWANGCSMEHSPRSHRIIGTSRCGENIYMSGSKKRWDEAIQAWYDEVDDYHYGVGSVNGGIIGHYTQLVWYRSNQIGCARASCPSAKYQYFYVCQYCPPGNYGYTHPYKEGTPCAACPDACDKGLCTNPCPYTDRYTNCPALKQEHSCKKALVNAWCPASCKCTNEIF